MKSELIVLADKGNVVRIYLNKICHKINDATFLIDFSTTSTHTANENKPQKLLPL